MRRRMLAIDFHPLKIWLTGILPALSVMVAPAALYAQDGIKAVEPYIVVVTTDKAPMRCSNGAQLFYAVRELKSGELLRVNGEGPGWLRAEYTPGMRAYVPASDVEADRDGKTVKLNKPSRLLAMNAEGKSRWWPLELDADIPAGTVMKVGEVFKTPENVIEGYAVDAPPKARGFVKPEQVRKATPEEAGRYLGIGQAAKPATPDPMPAKPADPGAKPAATTTPPVAGAGGDGKPAVAPAPTAANPPAAGTPSGFNPVAPVTTPAAATPPVEAPAATPAPTPIPPPPPPPKKDEEIEQIKAMYDKVMTNAGGSGDAELPTVVGLFERKMAKLGTDTKDQLIKTSLSQRLDALRLRQEIQSQRDQVKLVTVQQQQSIQRMSLIVSEAQKQAIYNIVGRIQPSTVYDGKRGLPLMYRVESADALSPRTVGYIIPTEGMDLLPKIGKVCGVLGESRMDSSLQLNIIAPRRIDVLDVGSTGTSVPGTFVEPGATPAPAPPPVPATVQEPTVPPEPEK